MPARRPKAPPPQPDRGGLWLAALLFCVVLATFLPCLRNGFVSLDDPTYAFANPYVKKGLTWEGFKWAWRSTEAQNWHPLTWMSHMLDAQLFGMNPAGHHAANVLLHAGSTALLFLLLRRMTGARWRSFAAAALFGLHPLRVESVAWISERKDVLGTFFWLLTTWAYVRYSEEARTNGPRMKRFYALSLGLFVLGLLSKPMLVTLPFALLLLDYWPLRRWKPGDASWLLLEKIPFFALAVADCAVTYLVQEHSGAITPMDALSLPARLANAMVSYVRYTGKMAWPLDLCVLYVHPGHWPVETIALAGAFVAIITGLVVWQRRTMPWLAVGWFWYLGTLVPVIGLVQVGRQAMADRYTYIPSIGLLIAFSWGAAKLTERWRNRKTIAAVALAAAGVICIALTVRQIGTWKDSESLYAQAAAATKRNWAALAYLAYALQQDGQPDKAVAAFKESLEINPNRGEVRCKLASLLLQQGRVTEALPEAQRAVELDPKDVDARKVLGAALQDLGRLDEAIEQFKQVVQLKPNDDDAYSNLGNCYGMKNRPDDALRCFEEAVRLKPNLAANHHDLGVGLANTGRWDEAAEQFKEAVRLDPSDAKSRAALELAMQQIKARGHNSN